MVGFRQTLYTVDEGGMVAFCVDVEGASRTHCVVNFPFNISFKTNNDSAGNSCCDLHIQWLVVC